MSKATSTQNIRSKLQALDQAVAMLNTKSNEADEVIRGVEEHLRASNPGAFLCLDRPMIQFGPRRLGHDGKARCRETFHLEWGKGEKGRWEFSVMVMEINEELIDPGLEGDAATWDVTSRSPHLMGPLLSQSRDLKRNALIFLPTFLDTLKAEVDATLVTLTGALRELADDAS